MIAGQYPARHLFSLSILSESKAVSTISRRIVFEHHLLSENSVRLHHCFAAGFNHHELDYRDRSHQSYQEVIPGNWLAASLCGDLFSCLVSPVSAYLSICDE
jgi:hypothetical protein